MRKILLVFFVFAFSSVSVSAQRNPLGEILKRMKEHRGVLMTLQGDITTTRFVAQPNATYMKEGAVKYLATKTAYYLRIDSAKPVSESFLLVNDQYLLYQPNPNPIYLPDSNTAYTGTTTDSQKNTLMIFSILWQGISKEDYTIKYIEQEKVSGTIPTWHLELIPKTASKFKTADLWIDANGMPLQAKITENSGDWTSVLLGNLVKNARMRADNFTITLPKGTKFFKD